MEVVIDHPGVEHDELSLITGGLETELTLSGDAQDGDISAEVTSSLPAATKDRMTFWILFRDDASKISGGSFGSAPGAFEPGATRTVSLFGPTNGGLPDRFASGEIYWDASASFLEDAGQGTIQDEGGGGPARGSRPGGRLTASGHLRKATAPGATSTVSGSLPSRPSASPSPPRCTGGVAEKVTERPRKMCTWSSSTWPPS